MCLIVPIKKIGEIPDVDDAAGRHLGGSGTQARNANNANEADDGSDAGVSTEAQR